MKTPLLRSPAGNRRRLLVPSLLAMLLLSPSPRAADDGPVQLILTSAGVVSDGKRLHTLSWPALGGATYRVQERGLLETGAWNTIDAVKRAADGTQTYEYRAPTGAGAEVKHFFRVILPATRIDQAVTIVPAAGGQFYITGECFVTGSQVLIGGSPASSVTFIDHTTLLVTAGALAAGNYDVSVTDGPTGPVVATLKNGLSVTATGRTDAEPPRLPPGAPVAGHDYEQESSGVEVPNPVVTLPEAQSKDLYGSGSRKQRPMFGTPRVNPATGELFVESLDLVLPGRVLPLVFARTYRSKAGIDTPMGQGWDHSYNIVATQSGPDIVVRDGAGRADRYFIQADGSFSCAGFFRRGTLAGNVFTLEFADKGRWVFRALDGSPAAGKIDQSIDRNGNPLAFAYDGAGRLTSVADPIGHSMTLGYSGAGRVQTLTDHTGRVLTYAHDAAGDLVSCTTPAVTGTPTANDFPTGKTVTFAYTSGTGDPARDHNLTTITDAAGAPWFSATFDPEPSASALLYDRIATMAEGVGAVPTMFFFKLNTPSPTNRWATTFFCCNDPLGNVCEVESDAFNRPVTVRNFTGRSAPGVIVTDTTNRPTGQVRPGDPPVFVTTCGWNLDSCCTDVTLPLGNGYRFVYESDLNPDGPQREQGNMRSCAEVPVMGEPPIYRLEYQPGFGTVEPGSSVPVKLSWGGSTDDGSGEDDVIGYSIYRALDGDDDTTPVRIDFVGATKQPTLPFIVSIPPLSSALPAPTYDIVICQPGAYTVDQCRIVPPFVIDLFDSNAAKGAGALATPPSAPLFEAYTKAMLGGVNPATSEPSDAPYVVPVRAGDATVEEPAKDTVIDGAKTMDAPPAAGDPWGYTPRFFGPSVGGGGHYLMVDGTPVVADVLFTKGTTARGSATRKVNPPGPYILIVDPRGNEETCTRDAAGNPTQKAGPEPAVVVDTTYGPFGQPATCTLPENDTGHREQITFNYYNSGPQNGWLQSCVEDSGAGGFNYVTAYNYNAAGCVTQVVDPRGGDIQFVRNSLNEVVRCTSREAAPGVRYQCDSIYDANGCVVRIDVQNKDEFGALGANTHFSTQLTRDPLGRVTQAQCEIDGVTNAQTQFEYDANSCLTRILTPLAVTGAQPLNTLRIIRDERNLPFRVLRAEGSADACRADYSYDANGNLVQLDEGSPVAILRTCTWDWDAYDRLDTATDAMGNETRYEYDAMGNCTQIERHGELTDVPGGAGNVLLARLTTAYDSQGRPTLLTATHFDPATAVLIGDGTRTSLFEYDAIGHVKRMTDDNGRVSLRTFDRANRLSLATDPKGNTIAFTYDANGNVTQRTQADKSDTAAGDQVFRIDYVLDGLDRCTSATDNAGNATQYAYDSRGNVVRTIDPLGRHTQRTVDGLGRTLQTGRDMNGNNAGFDAADIVRTFTWNLNSRRATSADDGGNTTTYAYDSHDRRTGTTFADGTTESRTYDALGSVATRTDANGTVTTRTHDANRRLTNVAIAPGAGVATTTTFETFEHEGRNALTRAVTNSGQVQYAYDSHGNLLRETQGSRIVTHTHDGVGNRLATASPAGRTLTFTYDAANLCRTTSLTVTSDGDALGQIVAHDYVGGRIERTQRRNGTETLFTYRGYVGAPAAPGDFGWGRVATITHQQTGGGTVLDSRASIYDRAQNKTGRADTRAGGPGTTHQYQYDAANRLVFTSVSTGGPPTRETNYIYDGNGNRQVVFGTNTPDEGSYIFDPTLPSPGDAQMNQYTASPVATYSYDANGNRIASTGAGGDFTFSYDYADRLVSILNVTTTLRVATYTYDALGQRIARTIDPDGAPIIAGFIYSDGQEIEERDAGGMVVNVTTPPAPTTTRNPFAMPSPGDPEDGVFPRRYSSDGAPKEEPKQVNSGASMEGLKSLLDSWRRRQREGARRMPGGPLGYAETRRNGVTLAFHGDDLGNTTATSTTGGAVAERYDFQDFGDPLIYTPGGTPLGATAVGVVHLFGGQRYDSETGFYSAPGDGVADPRIGRAIQRGGGTTNPWSR